jgi:outer membrane protein TolC
MSRTRPYPAWLVLAPLLAAAAAMAQPGQVPDAIGPEEAVRIALENHPLLDASAAGVRVAEAEKDYADSGYLPRVDLTEDFARSTNPVFVFASKLGQERFAAEDFDLDALNRPDPLTNSALRVSVQQNIWDAGRTISGKKAAAIGVAAAGDESRRAEDEVAFGALRAFWSQVVAGEMLRVALDAEKAAEANLALSGELVEAGLAVPSDRMSAEVRLAEIQAMRIRAEQGVQVARAALLQALGLEQDRELEAVPPPFAQPPGGDTLAARLESASRTRPDLLALAGRVEQARYGEKIAKSGRLPELGAMAAYEWNGESFLGTDGSNWTVGLGIRVSLFDGTETKARVHRAKAHAAQVASMLEAMRQGVELEVRAAWAERTAAERRLEVAERALQQSAEALRIVRDRYGEGMAVMVELLAAEAAHTKAQADHAAAEGDLRVAQAGLDLASGARPWEQNLEIQQSAARLGARSGYGENDDEIR